MARAAAPTSGRAEIRMPRIRHWWDDCTWTAFAASVEARAASASTPPQIAPRVQLPAAEVPEIALCSPSNPRHTGPSAAEQKLEERHVVFLESLLELGIEKRDQLQMECDDLSDRISTMRHERDQLQTQLRDLNSQVPTLSRERDELLAAVTPLRTELADLQTKDQELGELESEIRALRDQKASLDREIVSQLRTSTEGLRTPPNEYRFHDS
jgi:hypothetical protein